MKNLSNMIEKQPEDIDKMMLDSGWILVYKDETEECGFGKVRSVGIAIDFRGNVQALFMDRSGWVDEGRGSNDIGIWHEKDLPEEYR